MQKLSHLLDARAHHQLRVNRFRYLNYVNPYLNPIVLTLLFTLVLCFTAKDLHAQNWENTLRENLELYDGYHSGKLPLLEGQMKIFETSRDALLKPKQPSIAFASPTGTGKTVLMSHLYAGMFTRTGPDIGALFVVPYTPLLTQIKETLLAVTSLKAADITIKGGGFDKWGGKAQIITVSSLRNIMEDPRSAEKLLQKYKVVFVDEYDFQWGGEKTQENVLDAFKAQKRWFIGTSATPKEDIGFDVVSRMTIREAIEKHSLNASFKNIPYEVDFVDVASTMNEAGTDYIDQKLSRLLIQTEDVTRLAFEILKVHTKSWTIPFLINCVDVAHAKEVAEKFNAWDKNAKIEAVYSGDGNETRNETIERYERGALNGLSNVYVLGRGYNRKDLSVILNLAPTLNWTLATQRNRGTRVDPENPDKLNIVIDMLFKNSKARQSGKPTQLTYATVALTPEAFAKHINTKQKERLLEELAREIVLVTRNVEEEIRRKNTKDSLTENANSLSLRDFRATLDPTDVTQIAQRYSETRSMLGWGATQEAIRQWNEACENGKLYELVGKFTVKKIISDYLRERDWNLSPKQKGNTTVNPVELVIWEDISFFRAYRYFGEAKGWKSPSDFVSADAFRKRAETHYERWEIISGQTRSKGDTSKSQIEVFRSRRAAFSSLWDSLAEQNQLHLLIDYELLVELRNQLGLERTHNLLEAYDFSKLTRMQRVKLPPLLQMLATLGDWDAKLENKTPKKADSEPKQKDRPEPAIMGPEPAKKDNLVFKEQRTAAEKQDKFWKTHETRAGYGNKEVNVMVSLTNHVVDNALEVTNLEGITDNLNKKIKETVKGNTPVILSVTSQAPLMDNVYEKLLLAIAQLTRVNDLREVNVLISVQNITNAEFEKLVPFFTILNSTRYEAEDKLKEKRTNIHEFFTELVPHLEIKDAETKDRIMSILYGERFGSLARALDKNKARIVALLKTTGVKDLITFKLTPGELEIFKKGLLKLIENGVPIEIERPNESKSFSALSLKEYLDIVAQLTSNHPFFRDTPEGQALRERLLFWDTAKLEFFVYVLFGQSTKTLRAETFFKNDVIRYYLENQSSLPAHQDELKDLILNQRLHPGMDNHLLKSWGLKYSTDSAYVEIIARALLSVEQYQNNGPDLIEELNMVLKIRSRDTLFSANSLRVLVNLMAEEGIQNIRKRFSETVKGFDASEHAITQFFIELIIALPSEKKAIFIAEMGKDNVISLLQRVFTGNQHTSRPYLLKLTLDNHPHVNIYEFIINHSTLLSVFQKLSREAPLFTLDFLSELQQRVSSRLYQPIFSTALNYIHTKTNVDFLLLDALLRTSPFEFEKHVWHHRDSKAGKALKGYMQWLREKNVMAFEFKSEKTGQAVSVGTAEPHFLSKYIALMPLKFDIKLIQFYWLKNKGIDAAGLKDNEILTVLTAVGKTRADLKTSPNAFNLADYTTSSDKYLALRFYINEVFNEELWEIFLSKVPLSHLKFPKQSIVEAYNSRAYQTLRQDTGLPTWPDVNKILQRNDKTWFDLLVPRFPKSNWNMLDTIAWLQSKQIDSVETYEGKRTKKMPTAEELGKVFHKLMQYKGKYNPATIAYYFQSVLSVINSPHSFQEIIALCKSKNVYVESKYNLLRNNKPDLKLPSYTALKLLAKETGHLRLGDVDFKAAADIEVYSSLVDILNEVKRLNITSKTEYAKAASANNKLPTANYLQPILYSAAKEYDFALPNDKTIWHNFLNDKCDIEEKTNLFGETKEVLVPKNANDRGPNIGIGGFQDALGRGGYLERLGNEMVRLAGEFLGRSEVEALPRIELDVPFVDSKGKTHYTLIAGSALHDEYREKQLQAYHALIVEKRQKRFSEAVRSALQGYTNASSQEDRMPGRESVKVNGEALYRGFNQPWMHDIAKGLSQSAQNVLGKRYQQLTEIVGMSEQPAFLMSLGSAMPYHKLSRQSHSLSYQASLAKVRELLSKKLEKDFKASRQGKFRKLSISQLEFVLALWIMEAGKLTAQINLETGEHYTLEEALMASYATVMSGPHLASLGMFVVGTSVTQEALTQLLEKGFIAEPLAASNPLITATAKFMVSAISLSVGMLLMDIISDSTIRQEWSYQHVVNEVPHSLAYLNLDAFVKNNDGSSEEKSWLNGMVSGSILPVYGEHLKRAGIDLTASPDEMYHIYNSWNLVGGINRTKSLLLQGYPMRSMVEGRNKDYKGRIGGGDPVAILKSRYELEQMNFPDQMAEVLKHINKYDFVFHVGSLMLAGKLTKSIKAPVLHTIALLAVAGELSHLYEKYKYQVNNMNDVAKFESKLIADIQAHAEEMVDQVPALDEITIGNNTIKGLTDWWLKNAEAGIELSTAFWLREIQALTIQRLKMEHAQLNLYKSLKDKAIKVATGMDAEREHPVEIKKGLRVTFDKMFGDMAEGIALYIEGEKPIESYAMSKEVETFMANIQAVSAQEALLFAYGERDHWLRQIERHLTADADNRLPLCTKGDANDATKVRSELCNAYSEQVRPLLQMMVQTRYRWLKEISENQGDATFDMLSLQYQDDAAKDQIRELLYAAVIEQLKTHGVNLDIPVPGAVASGSDQGPVVVNSNEEEGRRVSSSPAASGLPAPSSSTRVQSGVTSSSQEVPGTSGGSEEVSEASPSEDTRDVYGMADKAPQPRQGDMLYAKSNAPVKSTSYNELLKELSSERKPRIIDDGKYWVDFEDLVWPTKENKDERALTASDFTYQVWVRNMNDQIVEQTKTPKDCDLPKKDQEDEGCLIELPNKIKKKLEDSDSTLHISLYLKNKAKTNTPQPPFVNYTLK